MVSYSNYWAFQNILQAEKDEKKDTFKIRPDTIAGFLHQPNFEYFDWIVKKADMELKMAHEQFDSTLFVVDNNYLIKQFNNKERLEHFLKNLDKNNAVNLLNAHILNRQIYKKTLLSQRLTKVYTKNNKTELMFLNNNGHMTINNKSNLLKEDIQLSNGLIHIVDQLFFPIF